MMMSSLVIAIFALTRIEDHILKRIPNRIFRYIVYAYIAVSGVIILMTN